MGALSKAGWQRLDVLVSEHGPDDVLHMVCDQVANGMSLSEIGRSEGVAYSVLWKWLKGEASRFKAYCDALEAKADYEAHKVIALADVATPEDVNVVKLQADVRKWAVGKWDRERYGEQSKVSVDVRYQVDLQKALEEAESRRMTLVGESVRVDDAEVI